MFESVDTTASREAAPPHTGAVSPASIAERAVREKERLRNEREARIAELCGTINAATAELVEIVADAVDDDGWQGAGIRSAAHWLSWRAGLSSGRARKLVQIAERRDELPAAIEAFGAGQLSEDQLQPMAKYVPAGYDQSATTIARNATPAQLQRTLSRYRYEHDSLTTDDTSAPATQALGFGQRDDNRWGFSGSMPKLDGAVVGKALHAARDDLWRSAEDDEARASIGWDDALLALADNYLDGASPTGRRADRYQVLVHYDARNLDDARAWIHLGPTLTQGELDQIGTNGASTRSVLHQNGTPVSVGRKQRVAPWLTRTLVEDRYRGCVYPGCACRHVDIHHLDTWEGGGATDWDNLAPLCSFHHHGHHAGEYMLHPTGDPLEPFQFREPDGTVIRAGPLPPAPGDPPDVDPYRHPTGERLETRWLIINPNRSRVPDKPDRD